MPALRDCAASSEDLEYRGDRIEYRIRVGDTLLVAVEAALGRRDRVAPGDRVGFELVDDALHLLPAADVGPRQLPRRHPERPQHSLGTTL